MPPQRQWEYQQTLQVEPPMRRGGQPVHPQQSHPQPDQQGAAPIAQGQAATLTNAPVGGLAGAGLTSDGGGDAGGGRSYLDYNVPGFMPGDSDLAGLMNNASVGAFVAYSGAPLD